MKDLLFWCICILGLLLVQIRFWWLMYLYCLDIRRCRCFFGSCCICKALIFAVADALFLTNVSATCFSLNLQILFNLPGMYNCIYILPFLGLEDTSFANFTSTSHIFDNTRMLLIEITHPLSQIPPANILWVLFISQLEPIHYLQKNWYKKFERIWSERWRHLERKFLC